MAIPEGVLLKVPAGVSMVCEDCGDVIEGKYVVIEGANFCTDCVELEGDGDEDDDYELADEDDDDELADWVEDDDDEEI